MKSTLLLLLLLFALTGKSDLLDGIEFFDVEAGQPIAMGAITPQTVTGFELLYATPGAGDISEIAGHLLLRIRLNNHPRALEEGFENPNDLVISFLADTQEAPTSAHPAPLHIIQHCHNRNWFNLINPPANGESPLQSIWQSLKGLSGGFRIAMDRQTLGHALKSYTIEQDRDLLRYRLDLSPQQTKSLIQHLEWCLYHYDPRYFFFSQNCGSALVQVIGQGIENKSIAQFSPAVAPPHTLVGNLVRENLAQREIPGFYSYRRRALIAQDLFQDHYIALQQEHPSEGWPTIQALFHRKEQIRADALAILWETARANSELHPDTYTLASLAQEADMLHSHKEWLCEDYTSEAVREARSIQKDILKTTGTDLPPPLELARLLNETHGPDELLDAKKGTPHTGLYPITVGWGYLEGNATKNSPVAVYHGALLRQEMGSPSSASMQRQSSLILGGVQLTADSHHIQTWKITGLKLQKFRDTLLSAPTALSSTRGLGIGLTVLDASHHHEHDRSTLTLAGGAVLANLAASSQFDNHLFVSAGIDTTVTKQGDHSNLSIRFPFTAQSLVTLGAHRRTQWRNQAIFLVSARDENSHEAHLHSLLAYRLGEVKGKEWWVECSLEYTEEFARGFIDDDRHTLLASLRLNIRRW